MFARLGLAPVFLIVSGLAGFAADSFVNVADYRTPERTWAQAILAAVEGNPGRTLRFPALDGGYRIDNSAGPLTIRDFSGAMHFDPGARLVCRSTARGCLNLLGGSGVRIDGLRIGYEDPPAVRINESAFYAKWTADLKLTGAVVESSPAAAILISASYRPVVRGAFVISSLADGISFENCEDALVADSTTFDTGDDGISFISYDRTNLSDFPDLRGGTAQNVKVRNSHGRGIAVAGQSNVRVSGFSVDGTAASGIIVLEDTSFRTRRPANVKFTDGLITDSGRVAPVLATPYGINFTDAASVEFSDIRIVNPGDRGLSGSAAGGRLIARNIHVTGGSDGINIGPVRSAVLTGLTVEDSDGYGIFIASEGWVVAENLRTVNVSRQNPLHRAVWFENNADVRVRGITVVDDQTSATGYVVGQFRNTRLSVSDIHAAIRSPQTPFVCPQSTASARFTCAGPPF